MDPILWSYLFVGYDDGRAQKSDGHLGHASSLQKLNETNLPLPQCRDYPLRSENRFVKHLLGRENISIFNEKIPSYGFSQSPIFRHHPFFGGH